MKRLVTIELFDQHVRRHAISADKAGDPLLYWPRTRTIRSTYIEASATRVGGSREILRLDRDGFSVSELPRSVSPVERVHMDFERFSHGVPRGHK